MRLEKRSFSAEKAFCAVNIAFRFAFASLCFERAWNLTKFGMAMAARMPMMATTIISSMRVKPFMIFFIGLVLLGGYEKCWSGRRLRESNRDASYNRLDLLVMPQARMTK